jgi:hypothetical protein
MKVSESSKKEIYNVLVMYYDSILIDVISKYRQDQNQQKI